MNQDFGSLPFLNKSVLAAIVTDGMQSPSAIAEALTAEFQENITPGRVSAIISDLHRMSFLKKHGRLGSIGSKIEVSAYTAKKITAWQAYQRDSELPISPVVIVNKLLKQD